MDTTALAALMVAVFTGVVERYDNAPLGERTLERGVGVKDRIPNIGSTSTVHGGVWG